MFTIRPATAADQPTIRAMIRAAGLNPVHLDWPHFLLALEGERVVGVGQVRPHPDGSRELASIAVTPARQGLGVGKALVAELVARETGVLYLFCMPERKSFYEPFGFVEIAGRELQPTMRRMHRLASVLMALMRLVQRRELRLVAMRRGAG